MGILVDGDQLTSFTGTSASLTTGQWTRITDTKTVSGTDLRIGAIMSGAPSGSIIYLDGVILESGDTASDYFDVSGLVWTLTGEAGTDGTDGAGYDYVMPENFGGPGIELDPFNTSININGPFGAYSVGSYVRYYPNPDVDPTAWVEGLITSKTGDEYLTISIDLWSETAPGIAGANFDATIRPYMTVTGKSGINYIPVVSVGLVTVAAPGNPPSVTMRPPSSSGTAPNITIEYVLDFDLPG
jgi:hypothetical protein